MHVSGHANQDELAELIALTRPKYFVPIHGEYRHLRRHVALAAASGIAEAHCFLLEDGEPLTLSAGPTAVRARAVEAGRILLEDGEFGDPGLLSERRTLGRDGTVFAVVAVSSKTGAIVAGPELTLARAFDRRRRLGSYPARTSTTGRASQPRRRTVQRGGHDAACGDSAYVAQLLQPRTRQAAAYRAARHGGLSAIARQPKAPIELEPAAAAVEIPPVAPAQNRVARELMALALLALAVFGVLSLVSAAAGQNPNLCGILGGAAAAMADDLFGVQAYLLAIMVAFLAIRVWSGAPGRTLMRESVGGAVLLVALSAGAGLFAGGAQSAGGQAGGAIGGALAPTLGSYLNVGGGYLCVMLAVIAALVMMLRRSPTELMAGLASSVRLRRREPRSLPIDDDGDWSAGDADISARAAASGTASAQSSAQTSADVRPLKVRRLEPTELRTRDNKSMRPGRAKGGYELPRAFAARHAARRACAG